MSKDFSQMTEQELWINLHNPIYSEEEKAIMFSWALRKKRDADTIPFAPKVEELFNKKFRLIRKKEL